MFSIPSSTGSKYSSQMEPDNCCINKTRQYLLSFEPHESSPNRCAVDTSCMLTQYTLFCARVVGGWTRPDCRGNRVEAGTNERENTPNLNVKIGISNAKMANTRTNHLALDLFGKNTCSPTTICRRMVDGLDHTIDEVTERPRNEGIHSKS